MSKNIPLTLLGLVAEAVKAGSWEKFKHDFTVEIKHGLYWHWTNDPGFTIDPGKGPRDLSSTAMGEVSIGALMITSDIDAWAGYDSERAYAAIIDMRGVPRNAYRQVGRGFGNEFFVTDLGARQARVVAVLPRKNAFAKDRRQRKYLPRSKEELYDFYMAVTGPT